MKRIGVEEPKYNRMTGKWSYGGNVYGSLAEANAVQKEALRVAEQQNLQSEISREITGQNKAKPVTNPVSTPAQPVSQAPVQPAIQPEVQPKVATPAVTDAVGSNIRNNVNIVKAKKIKGEYFLTDANGTQYKVNQKMYETARKAIKKGGKFNVNLNLDKTPIVNGGGGSTPVNPPKPEPVKPEPAKPKSGGFFSKVGNWIKNNKGKAALIAAGIIGLGAAIGIAQSSGDDKKVDNGNSQNNGAKVNNNEQQTDPQNTPPEEVNKPDGGEEKVTKPDGNVEKPDGNSEKPDGNVEKPESGQELVPGTPIDVNGTIYIVKKGDYLDKIAKEYLDKANGEGNYKKQEIIDLRNKIAKDNPEIKNVNLIYPGQQFDIKI